MNSISGNPSPVPSAAGAQLGGPGLPGTPEKGPAPAPGSGNAPVLTPKNLHALRTLFNIAHRLCRVLGPSWEIVSPTLSKTPAAPPDSPLLLIPPLGWTPLLYRRACSWGLRHSVCLAVLCSHAVLYCLNMLCCILCVCRPQVIETLAALDRTIHSPYATGQVRQMCTAASIGAPSN